MAKRKKRDEPIEPEVLESNEYYSAEQMLAMRELAAKGMRIKDIAAVLGCSKPEFYRRMTKNPRISETLAEGRAMGKEALLDSLHYLAIKCKDFQAVKFALQGLHNVGVNLDSDDERDEPKKDFDQIWQRLKTVSKVNRETMETLQIAGPIVIKKS